MEEYLKACCENTKNRIIAHEYQECEDAILKTMEMYPHSAVPHNLYGILLEKQHEHLLAMKHFRAAYALDPTYIPARYNMEQYGQWNKGSIQAAYCENDCVEICQKQQDNQFCVKYDEAHVGHMIRK